MGTGLPIYEDLARHAVAVPEVRDNVRDSMRRLLKISKIKLPVPENIRITVDVV